VYNDIPDVRLSAPIHTYPCDQAQSWNISELGDDIFLFANAELNRCVTLGAPNSAQAGDLVEIPATWVVRSNLPSQCVMSLRLWYLTIRLTGLTVVPFMVTSGA